MHQPFKIVRTYAHLVATGAPDMADRLALYLARKSLGEGGGTTREAHLWSRRSMEAQGQTGNLSFTMRIKSCCWSGLSASISGCLSRAAPLSAQIATQDAAQRLCQSCQWCCKGASSESSNFRNLLW